MSTRIISLNPSFRHLAFASFEGEALVDWGIKSVPIVGGQRDTAQLLDTLQDLIERSEPTVVVLPAGDDRRKQAQLRLIIGIKVFLHGLADSVVTCSAGAVNEYFRTLTGGRPTKHRIMTAIGDLFPELRRLVPKPRRLWESQDYWLPMFDAVARAVTWMKSHE